MTSRIRVASYNLRGLKDDPGAAAEVVRRIDPDVLLLQEVPRHPFSGVRIWLFARRCGLRWSGRSRRLSGTGMMTSYRVAATDSVDIKLPVAPRGNPRSYSAAQVRMRGGRAVTVVSLHLSLLEDERVTHATRILHEVTTGQALGGTGLGGKGLGGIGLGGRLGGRLVRVLATGPHRVSRLIRGILGQSGADDRRRGLRADDRLRGWRADAPMIVGGDLNEDSSGRAWGLLADRLAMVSSDRPTFPAKSPRRPIDAIFATSELTVLPHEDVALETELLSAATDHLPVWVDFDSAAGGGDPAPSQ